VNLYISKRDIETGEGNNSEECPIAQSLKRKFPETSVSVAPTRAKVGNVYFRLGVAGRRLVAEVDSGRLPNIDPQHIRLYPVDRDTYCTL
jgi:hypothetical protein